MNLFLTKAEIEKEKIEAITEKLYQRRFNDMFDVQFSFKRAREEAKEEGRMEGKMEGAKETTIELAKNFLKDGVPIKIISKNTGLDEDFLEQLDLETE